MRETKFCNKCNKEKYITHFIKNKNSTENGSWCQWCRYGNKYKSKYNKSIKGKLTIKKANDKAIDKPVSALVRYNAAVLIGRAGKRNNKSKIFSLTFEEYSKLVFEPCYYCNNLICSKRAERMEKGMGIDRINNSLGYELGNVLPCGGFCNIIRGNRLTVEETKEVIALLIKLRELS